MHLLLIYKSNNLYLLYFQNFSIAVYLKQILFKKDFQIFYNEFPLNYIAITFCFRKYSTILPCELVCLTITLAYLFAALSPLCDTVPHQLAQSSALSAAQTRLYYFLTGT